MFALMIEIPLTKDLPKSQKAGVDEREEKHANEHSQYVIIHWKFPTPDSSHEGLKEVDQIRDSLPLLKHLALHFSVDRTLINVSGL